MAIDTIESRVRAALSGSAVAIVGPSDSNYEELLVRWSDAAVKRAVRFESL